MADASELELERAVRMLDAAITRMPESTIATRTIVAGHSRDDGRLVCLIEAASLESARRLVSLALLPPGRLREITRLAGHDRYSAVTQEAMLTLEFTPSLLRML